MDGAAVNSITVVGSHQVLVTLTMVALSGNATGGALMSFIADNGATIEGADVIAADAYSIEGGTQETGKNQGQGASYLVAVQDGTTTFTARYRCSGSPSGTVVASSRIIVQIY